GSDRLANRVEIVLAQPSVGEAVPCLRQSIDDRIATPILLQRPAVRHRQYRHLHRGPRPCTRRRHDSLSLPSASASCSTALKCLASERRTLHLVLLSWSPTSSSRCRIASARAAASAECTRQASDTSSACARSQAR